MDLAKIRQKSRQEQAERHQAASRPLAAELPVSPGADVASAMQQSLIPIDFIESLEQELNYNLSPDGFQTPAPLHRIVPRDPYEAILSGREAAGCGENLNQESESQTDTHARNHQEFLCFKVSDEIYGIDIMDIKELIKPREVTEVPRTPSFVSGIISLRGVIIPIIDMLERLGLARENVTGRERVIVVRQGESFCGLLVDEIIQVVRISKDAMEAAPTVLEGIDRDFVTGIGRADGRMIIILNLTNIIDIHLY